MKGWNGVRAGVYAAVVFASGVLTLMAPLGAVDTRTARLIDEAIERHKPEIIKIRRFIHMNPELSNREFETARLIASKLSALGLETRTGVAKTGVVGLLRGGQQGPTVALRADMDALPIQETTNVPFQSLNPGVMHACGHDIHMAVALGTAMVLKDLKDRVKGGVKFIFQPAEEGPPAGEEGGAALMIREGVLENPRVSAIFGLHVWNENVGQVLFSPGNIMAASDGFQIVVKGRSAHGARPQEGVDAIVVASHIVAALQTVVGRSIDPTDPAVITVGRIEGGTRANIIADKVTLEGTIRTMSDSNRKRIPALIETLVKGIVQSFGASHAFDYRPNLPPVHNHPELAKTMLPSLIQAMGKDKVLDLAPQMVSEDFAFFAQKIPGLFFFLGVKNPSQASPAALHTPRFNPDERAIAVGIRAMCHLILDALEIQSTIGNHHP
jgi:amidohydrolase